MKRKGKGKPKKLRLTEDELTALVLQEAAYNPNLTLDQRRSLIDTNLQGRKARERAAKEKAERLRAKRENS